MTVIVATFEGVWADRRVTAGASVYIPQRKVGRNSALVAAFCGGSAACTKALIAVRKGETDVQALAAIEDGVVVNAKGLWELSGGVAVKAPRRITVLFHGSGHLEAQAYIAGAGCHDAATIRKAIRYVGCVRTDCGDGCDAALFFARDGS